MLEADAKGEGPPGQCYPTRTEPVQPCASQTDARVLRFDEVVVWKPRQPCPKPLVLVPQSLIDAVEEIANRLAAAKPVQWRGRGELPQRPWPVTRRGLWLFTDMWAGIASTVVAMLALGVRCSVLTSESDSTAKACVLKAFPSIVHVYRVEDIQTGMFSKLCERRSFQGVIVVEALRAWATRTRTKTAVA